MRLPALYTLIGLTLSVVTPAGAATVSGNPDVIDADTLRFDEQVVRLLDVDAFELAQRCDGPRAVRSCGTVAADALREKVARGAVLCEGQETDDYDRLLARCRLQGEDLSTWLVAQGYGLAYRRYSTRLVAIEDQAKADRRGMWAGAFEAPWAYRAHRWDTTAQAAPEGCPIKGNINRLGVGIYHTPWSRWYDRTKISTKNGERWFCDEKQALAAGFRAPLVD